MLAELQSWISDGRIAVSIVDVDSMPQLVERYGERVPVLEGDGQEICHYFLDPQRLGRYLEKR
jgi:thioredoxin reductase (NADPH)